MLAFYYTSSVNLKVKVLDFVKSGGPARTELRTFRWGGPNMSLSQKPDTPRVVDFWMSALAGITFVLCRISNLVTP